MNRPAKARLFGEVLPGLKAARAYFSRPAIQAAATAAGLELKPGVLNVYLHQAVKQGLIHDAGRGWYSRLGEPVLLDVNLSSKLIRAVEKAFPLLGFTVWSTAQFNPWMHHLLARPVAFLYAPRVTLDSVGEMLRDAGWEVTVNPGKRQAAKAVRPGEKMVVLRPVHSKQPSAIEHQAIPEQVVVELAMEAAALSLMAPDEAEAATGAMSESGVLQIPVIQRFAEYKKARLGWLDAINQRHFFEKSGDN